ncbi:helix-turn-helix domain-containing protein [Allofournierella sp.]|uniref:helix-turn-helix domain-containing protein n=1 Tax=Allofournierella sp. TaxID=1940256 RepID=UPI003AB911C4
MDRSTRKRGGHITERILRLMAERGWSRYELAKRAGLSETTVANLFRRCNAPSIPTLEAITKACGITMAQFFTEGDDPVVLSQEQRALLIQWSVLTQQQQALLLQFISMNKL